MATTFLKRQKEMKRLEKQREKAERRAQKKLAKGAQNDLSAESLIPGEGEVADGNLAAPPESAPHN